MPCTNFLLCAVSCICNATSGARGAIVVTRSSFSTHGRFNFISVNLTFKSATLLVYFFSIFSISSLRPGFIRPFANASCNCSRIQSQTIGNDVTQFENIFLLASSSESKSDSLSLTIKSVILTFWLKKWFNKNSENHLKILEPMLVIRRNNNHKMYFSLVNDNITYETQETCT